MRSSKLCLLPGRHRFDSWYVRLFILASFLFIASTQAFAALDNGTTLSPREILSRFSIAVDWTGNSAIKMKAIQRVSRKDPAGKVDNLAQEADVELYRSKDGEVRFRKQNKDGTGRFDIFSTRSGRICWNAPGRVDYSDSPRVASYYDDGANNLAGCFLDGITGDDTRIDLAKLDDKTFAIKEAASEKIQGLDCRVIEVSDKFDVIRVWIAPERDYNVVHYTLDRSPEMAAKKGMYHLTVDDIHFRQVQGRWIISEGKLHDETGYATPGGTPAKIRDLTVIRTDADLSPDFQKLGIMNSDWVPDGTPVTIEDWSDQTKSPVQKSDGIKYVWEGGKPVADFDPDLVNRIRKQLQDSTRKSQ